SDRPRTMLEPAPAGYVKVKLGHELSNGFKALCRSRGVTLYMGAVAVLKALLFRYTHERDVVIGTAIANRNRSEIEELIGFFVNTLVLRTALTPDWTFKELLDELRDTVLSAYAHQDLAFELLV